jgi:ABC-type molybdate transport system substrate-binding protein
VLALLLAWLVLTSRPEAQQTPRVASAANLNFALAEIAGRFARDRGSRVELVFGASATLTRLGA